MKKLSYLVLLTLSSYAFSDYREDVGFNQLQSEIGALVPDGAGVNVSHVEAAISDAWMPNDTTVENVGKTIIDVTGSSAGYSGHATGVGSTFYGNNSSMTSGVTNISGYSAVDWLLEGFLNTGETTASLITNSRVTNHSWVGEGGTPAETALFLKRVDWVVEQNESIQVVAMNNGSSNRSLISNAYNTIAVGRTDGNHAQGTNALDSVYVSGRTRPDVVSPKNSTSGATPIVASAVVMLIDQAHTAASGPTEVISNGSTIYNGERSEVVKAIIMAGADRVTDNTFISDQIDDYRLDVAHQTDNGLDSRYGAGQINVLNNHDIMAAGEQDSQEDGGATLVDQQGYDYDASFGDTQTVATYQFAVSTTDYLELTASLVWNIDVEEDASLPEYTLITHLYDLNLSLYDLTSGLEVDYSTSTVDNTENIRYVFQLGHSYQLRVSADGSPFDWDYGIAWNVSAVPVPASIWFFASAILGLVGVRKKKVI